MGNIISPPKETIVLIPPRISTRGLTRPIELENPMSVGFGNLFRKEVLLDLHNFDGRMEVDVLLAPEQPPVLAAHLSMLGAAASRSVQGGFLNLHLNSAVGNDFHVLGRLSLGSDSSLTGYTMLSHNSPWGQLSVTGKSDSASGNWLGVRGRSEFLTMGAEVPVSDAMGLRAYAIARIANMFSVGVCGSPLRREEPTEICLSVDRAIPKTDSSYCVSASVQSPSNQLTVGFTQHLVTHRKVYNPFEDKRVKYIANYVDLAVEADAGNVSGGVSWQPNKNVLTKLHVSTNKGAVASLAVRNWWVPSVLGSVSTGVGVKGNFFIGMRLQVSNWLSLTEYSKGQAVSALPATRWISVEDVSPLDSRYRGV
jgi:hypothetical protein